MSGQNRAPAQIIAGKRPSRKPAMVQWRADVAAAFHDAGMSKVARHWESCSDPSLIFTPDLSGTLPPEIEYVLTCSEKPSHYAKTSPITCKNRFCPECAQKQQNRLVRRYLPEIERLLKAAPRNYSLKHVVLTTRIEAGNPRFREHMEAGFEGVRRLWEKLFGKRWRKKVGCLVTAEVSPGKLLLHFHVVLLSPFVEKERLNELWRKLSPDGSYVTFIKAPVFSHGKSTSVRDVIRYGVKYAVKPVVDDGDGNVSTFPPELVVKLYRIFAGKRRVRSYGLFYGLETEDQPAACPECDAPIIAMMPIEWLWYCETGFMPQEQRVVLGDLGALYLKTGNKSPPEAAKEDENLPVQLEIPGLISSPGVNLISG